jgi:hypothetical protein
LNNRSLVWSDPIRSGLILRRNININISISISINISINININLPGRASANKGSRDEGMRRRTARHEEKQTQLHGVGIELTINGICKVAKANLVEKKDPTSKFKVHNVFVTVRWKTALMDLSASCFDSLGGAGCSTSTWS